MPCSSDGLPWVDRAQEEHDSFAETLSSRGVEVLYLSDLLVETLPPRLRMRRLSKISFPISGSVRHFGRF